MTWLLDTNVLVYAVGDPAHPLAEPARRILRAAAQPGRATTTHGVVQEFMHVYARRRGRQNARHMAMDLADLLAPLVPISDAALRRAGDIYVEHEAVGAFDAVLAAVVLGSDEFELVSADAGFAQVPQLAVLGLADVF